MCGIQFGAVARPTHPSTSWDAAKFEVCAHRYVDVAEPAFGVAVLNDGRYGHALFDGAVRVSLARSARYPDPDPDKGRHEVTISLFPHRAGRADVVAEAERLDLPVRAFVGGGAQGIPAPVVRVTGVGVEVDAVKLADDGSGDLVVRLHEAGGDRARVSVRADGRITAASRCNLLEEPANGFEVSDGIVALTLRPYELVTLGRRQSAEVDVGGRRRRTWRCRSPSPPRRRRTRFEWFGAALARSRSGWVPPRNIIAPGTRCST